MRASETDVLQTHRLLKSKHWENEVATTSELSHLPADKIMCSDG